ncbi:hypothetical protein BC834DRAFT_911925, partial [Gloeopeniophorella convolvens]
MFCSISCESMCGYALVSSLLPTLTALIHLRLREMPGILDTRELKGRSCGDGCGHRLADEKISDFEYASCDSLPQHL